MRVLTLCLGIGIMLTAACGGSSSNSGTGGTSGGGMGAGGLMATGGLMAAGGMMATGGLMATGGAGAGGSIPLTGNCANLTCLNPLMNLLSGCQSSGTCTSSSAMTGTSIVATQCYSNGVKEQTSMDMSSATTPMTMTVKNGSSVCYSMVIGGVSLTGATTSMTIAINNGSGTLVGTIGLDTNTDTESVTCPGGAATVIDATCGSASGFTPTVPGSSTSTCTQGTCTF